MKRFEKALRREGTAFTMANRLSNRTRTFGYSLAFTMAEILISLTIIGIVAAITLPSLMANVTEKAWDAQRKALHTRLAQAIATVDLGDMRGYKDGDTTVTGAEKFIREGIGRALSLKDKSDAQIVPSVFNMNGGITEDLHVLCSENGIGYSIHEDPSCGRFQTANGESVMVTVAESCMSDEDSLFESACLNFIYDLNGIKGPNTVGKDIGFMTAFYADKPLLVAPMPAYYSEKPMKPEGIRGKTDYREGRLPSPEEMMSIVINQNLIGLSLQAGSLYWTSEQINAGYAIVDGDEIPTGNGYAVGNIGKKKTSLTTALKYFLVTPDGSAPKKFRIEQDEEDHEPEAEA